MTSIRALFIALGLVFTPALAQAGDDYHSDDDVAFENLPPPVKATVQREVKGGQILDIERDTRQGQPIFEVEFVDEGVKWELHVAMDGKLLHRRQD